MRATEQLGRYRLLDLVTQDAGREDGHDDVSLWHAYDEVLDRNVAIRVMSTEDSRSAALLGAAQAASGVDDRRLLRVLDIVDLPATATDPSRIAVVSEWATGRNVERAIEARSGTPYAPVEALALAADVARAIAAGSAAGVGHGRLRPSSVFVTDAGEVRVRGLAVDAAIFGLPMDSTGQVPSDRAQSDVDSLGSLVYLLSTGRWPGASPTVLPAAPRVGGSVLPPSQVRAALPRSIDDIVSRSISAIARPRGVARVVDPSGFANMVGAALDHVAPISTTVRAVAPSRRRRTVRRILRGLWRTLVAAFGLALVAGIAWVGWQFATGGPAPDVGQSSALTDQMLTEPAHAADDVGGTTVQQAFPITKYRSYDPFGDDDGNGRIDKRKGLENDDLAVTVNDEDPDTAWLTAEYQTPQLDGKPGVGLILDLGAPRDVQQVSLKLVGKGSSVEVRMADRILSDPALWTPLASAAGAGDTIDLRAPRPVTGRYVLVWFTRVPPSESQAPGVYQGGVRAAAVSG
jgi:hypothetical protein